MTAAATDVDVVDDLARARALLDPTRLEVLEALDEPASAAALAARLGAPRQRLNYHLRALEEHGFVELVEERRRGSVVERVVRRTADALELASTPLGPLGSDPERLRERASAAFQAAVAARTLRELADLGRRAAAARKRLSTLTLDTTVRFADAAARDAFADELATAVAELVARHHDDRAPGGRAYRLAALLHVRPKDEGAQRSSPSRGS